MIDRVLAFTPLYSLPLERIVSNQSMPRFVPLQSAPMWNGCGRPTAIHECVIVKHRARQVISAIRTLENQLWLNSWRVDARGTAVCTGVVDAQIENVAQVALTRASKYISGCRTFDGRLQLRSWDVSNTGALYASGAPIEVATNYSWIQLLALTPNRLLTIGLTMAGEWELQTWSIDDGGALRPLADATLPATTGAIDVVVLGPTSANTTESSVKSTRFLMVRQYESQTVQWTEWRCTASGELIVENEATMAAATVVDLKLTLVDGHPVTLLHRANGKLQAFYGLPTADSEFTSMPVVKPSAGQLMTLAEQVRLFTVTHDTDQLTVAYVTARMNTAQDVRPLDGMGFTAFPEVTTIQMQRWQAASKQWVQAGNGSIPIATATELSLCDQPLDGNAPFLTAIGTVDGMLHLVTWSDTLQIQLN